MDMQKLMDALVPLLSTYGLKVIGAIIILIIGRFAAGAGRRIVKRIMTRASIYPGIISFASSMVYALVLTVAVLASLSKFGVETTAFVAVLGALGFAVGFALQGSLSNFAAGILILILRPYRVGDFIEGAGVAGSVEDIQLFSTILNTPDNIRVLVPNAKLQGDVIKNMTWNPTRRVNIVIGIGYGSSIKKANELLNQILSEDDRILPEPAPTVALAELADSSVNFVVRPWVKRENYWALKCDLLEKIKHVFDENDIEIPFPHQSIHVTQVQ
jgi:small conductance mechanosensitive channel